MKTIFIGTSSFASNILEKLIADNKKPSFVVTVSDQPAGRGKKIKESPVSILAKKNNISVLKPLKISDLTEKIKEELPEVILVCAYGQKIPKEILSIPSKGCLNVHPSLLPKYRGASPITQAILNGDKETGITIMLMDEEMDQGPIVSQERWQMDKKIRFEELSYDLSIKGGELLSKILPKWVNGLIVAKDQDHSKATYTKIIEKKDGKINWNEPASTVERKTRALNPWPGTFTYYNEGKMLKIIKADVQKQTKSGPFGIPGKVYLASNEKLAVQTGKDFLIIEELQLEGKKSVKTKEFINGNINFIGTILK